MRPSFLIWSNVSSVRWVKSSQGICRGTCGWITSFLFFIVEKSKIRRETNVRCVLTNHYFYNDNNYLFSIFFILWARSSTVERRPCTRGLTQAPVERGGGFGFKSRRVHSVITEYYQIQTRNSKN